MNRSTNSIVIALVILLGLSCNKKDNTPALADNTWVLGTKTVKAEYIAVSTPGANNYPAALNIIDDSAAPQNIMHIDFASWPAKPGPLKVSYDAYEPNEIRIFAYGNIGDYVGTEDAQSSALIYNIQGKRKLLITNALLKPFAMGAADTALVRLNALISLDQ